jgi:hypothetical protein
MPTATGSYEQIDGSPVVRFERTFPHAVAQVWDAITDPARLEKWFPTTVEFDTLRAQEPITFRFAEDRYPPMAGAFREVSQLRAVGARRRRRVPAGLLGDPGRCRQGRQGRRGVG